jgi:hypothetical protein
MTARSFSLINRDRYFVFMTVTAENPVSHKFVVQEGSKTCMTLSGNVE